MSDRTSGQEGNVAGPITRTPADRWPMFRGNPQMTGVSASKLPPNPGQLWFVELKESIEATAAIVSGEIFIPTMEGSCVALSLDNGKQLWKYSNPNKDACKSSPCITDKLVMYGDDLGTFRALDRATGKEQWKFSAQGEIISSPIVVDGKAIFGSYDETLYCLDADTGKKEWELKTQGPVHCSPSLVGGQVVVAGCDGFIRLVNIGDGKEVKSLEIGGNIASTPAVDDKLLYFGTMSNQVIAVDWDSMKRIWTFDSPKRRFPFYASPALANQLVLVGGRDKLLRALDKATGEERWSVSTEGRVDSSPVVVGDIVFFGSNDGNLHSANVKTGQASWEFPTGAPISASPAVAAGKLVIGTQDGTVFCFGARASK